MNKYINIVLSLIIFPVLLFSSDIKVKKPNKHSTLKSVNVTSKKARFYSLLVKPIQKVHEQLMDEYLRVKSNMQNKTGLDEIKKLKSKYKVKSDLELLYALKPHPQSIVLAQAIMESAWATSRFFREANNVFGMWSTNKKQKRIPAKIKRGGTRTIWLRKFDSVDDSIRAYYFMMAKGKAFKQFRKTRYETDNVFVIVKKLDKYSEIGDLYAKELSQIIRYNKLTRYDK